MSEKLVRSMMVIFHVPLALILLRMCWYGYVQGMAGTDFRMMPFQLISLALAVYLVRSDSTRDEYYPMLLALLVYDLVLYWYILN